MWLSPIICICRVLVHYGTSVVRRQYIDCICSLRLSKTQRLVVLIIRIEYSLSDATAESKKNIFNIVFYLLGSLSLRIGWLRAVSLYQCGFQLTQAYLYFLMHSSVDHEINSFTFINIGILWIYLKHLISF